MVPRPLFHILAARTWDGVQATGRYEPESLSAEGFIHLSYDHQVAGTLQLRYRDVPGLVVLELDPARLTSPVVVEDSYGSGVAFPHLYGPMPVSAVAAVRSVEDFTGRSGPAATGR